MRYSGILMHVSSLPNKYGIGTFGKEAYDFVDFLNKAKQKYWQILPLGPTSYGDSPYQAFSAFAGNPYFIDFDLLNKDGLLKKSDYKEYQYKDKKVNYEWLYKTRFIVLEKAYKRFDKNIKDYIKFKEDNNGWLDDYSLFMAIKNEEVEGNWLGWKKCYRTRSANAISEFKKNNEEKIEFWKFVQYEFYKQWFNLKHYANSLGIEIIGDMPIYVAFDSSDVWSNPKYFQLDKDLNPVEVAGCPPDAFTPDGQLWGNPLYNYDLMEKEGYKWWIERIKASLTLFDVVRIDHFRGFEAYYAIPNGDVNARRGKWKLGPNVKLFNKVKEVLGDCKIIAEDLGFLTEEVHIMLKECGYPGMEILEFGFDASGDSDYAPHNHKKNAICYPGTHDNHPVGGWLDTLDEENLDYVKKYLMAPKKVSKDKLIDLIIASCLGSVSDTAIVPLVDYLHLGNDARFNTPSTLGDHNWTWRVEKRALNDKLIEKIKDMTITYRRAK